MLFERLHPNAQGFWIILRPLEKHSRAALMAPDGRNLHLSAQGTQGWIAPRADELTLSGLTEPFLLG